MKIKSILLAAVCMSLAACIPEVNSNNAAASENLEKSKKFKDIGLISNYSISDCYGFPAASVDVRHVIDTNGCDFIVASTAARSSGTGVSIIHSPTCRCQKK